MGCGLDHACTQMVTLNTIFSVVLWDFNLESIKKDYTISSQVNYLQTSQATIRILVDGGYV